MWMWKWMDVERWMKKEPKSLPLELVFPSQRFRPAVAIATKPSFRSVSALLSFLLRGQRCLISHFYCRCYFAIFWYPGVWTRSRTHRLRNKFRPSYHSKRSPSLSQSEPAPAFRYFFSPETVSTLPLLQVFLAISYCCSFAPPCLQ